MYSLKILTPLLACAWLALGTPLAQAQNRADDALLEMQKAFRKGDSKKLEQLLPTVRGHALEPWAAYWTLKAQLNEATGAEVQTFLQRYPGTYQEDRLRNDWLLLLGQRRDWAQFAAYHPQYRMQDDREVRCYALLIDQIKGTAPANAGGDVQRAWFALRDADDGCTHAASQFYADGKLSKLDVWRKARLAVEANRPRAARNA
ncbi:MAG: lytic transglycosylase domain-containing protein, partial [Giesbergeria sp.]|nr:lytic transglycosylase domain-containing protein [Giesbergeria sp.]